MKRLEWAPLLHTLSSLLVIALSYWAGPRLAISRDAARSSGAGVFLVGMSLFAWTLTHLRRGFLGEIQPVTDYLVTTGPYRYVRHPLYLSMLIALTGIAILFRSVSGLASAFLLFLPAAACRAVLEERALADEFGADWDHYAVRASFMLPGL